MTASRIWPRFPAVPSFGLTSGGLDSATSWASPLTTRPDHCNSGSLQHIGCPPSISVARTKISRVHLSWWRQSLRVLLITLSCWSYCNYLVVFTILSDPFICWFGCALERAIDFHRFETIDNMDIQIDLVLMALIYWTRTISCVDVHFTIISVEPPSATISAARPSVITSAELSPYGTCSQSCINQYFGEYGCADFSTRAAANDCVCGGPLGGQVAACVGALCGMVEANETAYMWDSNCRQAGASVAIPPDEFISLAQQASNSGVSFALSVASLECQYLTLFRPLVWLLPKSSLRLLRK